jgi:hypothetical protein
MLFFVHPMSVRKVTEKVSTTTLTNSTAETLLASFTIPALSHANQGGSRAMVIGTMINAGAGAVTVTLRTKVSIGASTVTLAQTSALSLSTSASNRHWATEVQTIGTTQPTQLRVWTAAAISNPSTRSLVGNAFTLTGTNTVSVPNSTATATYKFTAQLSAASTARRVAATAGWLETIA